MSAVRYKKSVQPVPTDGRNIDVGRAEMTGEAASQEASGSGDEHISSVAQTWRQLPQPNRSDPTYYDRPLLKEPVWDWTIPVYFYAGGLGGAALVLAAAVQLRSSKQRARLIRRCRWMGFIAACISGALLIYDLGRPSRFFNMLRVFRPTSPMNMGVWILTATVGTSMMTLGLRNRNGLLGDIGDACGYASGIAGMGFATYTGVLVSSTAIPVWQESRRVLPVLFAASAMNSVGSVFEMFVEDPEERRITKAFGTAGQIAGMVAGIVMEKHASVVDRVGRPFKQGLSGVMWKTAAVLTATSAAVGVLPGRSRNKRLIAGALGTLGSILTRFAIQRAGVASARDARASFHQQRAAMER